jgi:hypothetical protein
VPPREQPASPAVPTAADDVEVASDVETAEDLAGTSDVAAGAEPVRPEPAPGIVDWHRTGRRLRRQAVVLVGLVVVAWLALGVAGDGLELRSLAELFGLGVLLAIAGEVVIVGGAALGGMINAGERGDRLSSSDVSLLPPQVTRRLRRRG